MMMCVLLMVVVVSLLSSCDALKQNCKCGVCDLTDKDQDKVLWKCQKEKGLAEKELTSKLNSNEAVCLNYRVTASGDCDFRKELLHVALANPIKDICNPSQTFPRRCSIHNHPEFSYKCHRSQQFCAYKTKCPAGYYHMPIITSLDLPRDDDGECIDKVSITYDSDKVITICGSQVDADRFNYRKDRLSSLPLTITFESSQCCHNCGFHIWVSCVPDPIISGSRLSPFTQGYRNPQRNYIYRDERRGDVHVSVPLGAQVVYKDLFITVVKGDQSLYQFTDMQSLKVVDDLLGNNTYYTTAENVKLYGHGLLKVHKDSALYENTRIPSEIKPNYLENGYIIDTVKLLSPFLINSTYQTFIEPASKVPLPIIAGKLNRYKPQCQETAEITMGFPHASCNPFHYPTPRDISRALSEAKYLRRNSRNPFVLTVAGDAIEMLQDLTSD
ncbi:PREDICTED: uncharacterized protein LOC100641969 [Amphimedon queenslandica]|uniref:CUB domain-containing protein n=1 Tax=Amphimedon queenslandica TaxID=400682 RepID=A0A1X7UYU5_AMPQE|nr:PREDICTED: uncharacterized protein LOC100641969 [Amphimedon queenslandica]|eukprot:XP_003386297.2 PREDICTED: uncharacterized protein LOC100641969 [Amphimedon queenslandica]